MSIGRQRPSAPRGSMPGIPGRGSSRSALTVLAVLLTAALSVLGGATPAGAAGQVSLRTTPAATGSLSGTGVGTGTGSGTAVTNSVRVLCSPVAPSSRVLAPGRVTLTFALHQGPRLSVATGRQNQLSGRSQDRLLVLAIVGLLLAALAYGGLVTRTTRPSRGRTGATSAPTRAPPAAGGPASRPASSPSHCTSLRRRTVEA